MKLRQYFSKEDQIKENSNSENQSILLSIRNQEQIKLYPEKPRQQRFNTSISQSSRLNDSAVKCQQCHPQIQQLQQTIHLLNIRLQKVQTNLNLSFTKHMSHSSQIGDTIQKQQQLSFTMHQLNQDLQSRCHDIQLQLHQGSKADKQHAIEMEQLKEQLNKLQQQTVISCTVEYQVKHLEQRVERLKEEFVDRVYDVIGSGGKGKGTNDKHIREGKNMGNQLRDKMRTQKSRSKKVESRIYLDDKLNESTMIGISRNYE